MHWNTTQMGTSGWQQFVFEGTTPDDIYAGLKAESRIELATAGATNVTAVSDSFAIHKGDTLKVNHITCENDLATNNYMITQLRTSDIAVNLPTITSQQEDVTTISGGTILLKTYSDNTKDLVVYNPEQNTQTVQGITSDAKVWLLHAGTSGNWSNGNLFQGTGSPIFSGYSVYPSVMVHNGTSASGGQYEITF